MTEFLDLNERVLADIRSAADIVEVIGEHTTLKKAGKSWKGLCPFHREKTPSFTVNRDRGLFYCFGCGAGGDLISFVRQIERVDFPEAAEILARRFGVEIPRKAGREKTDRREKLYAAVEAAQRLYAEQLESPGSRALEYLKERGVPAETARELGLGAAPESWDFLARSLSGRFSPEILVEAGLLQAGTEGKRAYDRFRGRLLFPIRDERARAVGFGGRTLTGEEPKYLNSPESPIFSKNRTLYGLSGARTAMRSGERAVLVEGYFDHLAFHLSGHPEAVATMGTSLTTSQAERLRRLVSRATLAYDGDSAGRAATMRAIPLLLAEGLEVFVARVPAGIDPFDLYRESGPKGVEAALEAALPFLDWVLEELRPEAEGLSPAEKGGRINRILAILDNVADRVVRYEYARRVAERASLPLELVWKAKGASRTPGEGAGTKTEEKPLRPLPAPEGERRLLKALLSGGRAVRVNLGEIDPEYLADPRARAILLAIRDAVAPEGSVDVSLVASRLKPDSETAFFSELVVERDLEDDEGGTREDLESILRGLKKRFLDTRAESLQQAIEAAEKRGDREEATRLSRAKLALRQESQDLARGGKRAEH